MAKSIRYILEAIGVKLIVFLFKLFSFKSASCLGGILFKVIGTKLKVSNVAKSNLERVLGLTPKEATSIVKEVWENLGRNAGEFVHIHHMEDHQFNELLEIRGKENLKFLEKGGFLFTAHIGNWEILPRFIHQNGFKMALVYRKANNQFVDKMIIEERIKFSENIPKGKIGVKSILNSLKEKKVVGMLVDQKMNEGIEVPFFGFPSMTAPALAKLALKIGVPIVPIRIIRKNNSQFIVEISKPLNLKNKDIYSVMLEVNKTIESWVMEHPGQWFWLHKRWGKFPT